MIYHFGLTGFPLGHSLSPIIHQAALKSTGQAGDYKLFPMKSAASLESLLLLLRQGELQGLNVTIPHKQHVLNHVDLLSHTTKMTGAVNTLYLRGDQLVGDNTDVAGFLTDLNEKIGSKGIKHTALILGAGGAARAVAIGLLSVGWKVGIAARDFLKAQETVKALTAWARSGYLEAIPLSHTPIQSVIGETGLLVNATPAGMMPNILLDPLPAEIRLPDQIALYDLVYNPAKTALMNRFREEGKMAFNGLGMLVEQAAQSFELWTGMYVSRAVLWQALSGIIETSTL